MSRPSSVVQVFCKAPIAGEVKTRTQPQLSAEQAARLHQQLSLRTLQEISNSAHYEIELWCAPNTDHHFFQEIESRYAITLKQQCEGDLGARMSHAMQTGLKDYRQAVLIGTDCPGLSKPLIEQAIKALQNSNDCCIAPVEDGGYCLIGANTHFPQLFDNIPWSTDTVFSRTVTEIKQLDLKYYELPRQWDVDDYNDYLRLVAQYPQFSHT